jgi:hypothetical protein
MNEALRIYLVTSGDQTIPFLVSPVRDNTYGFYAGRHLPNPCKLKYFELGPYTIFQVHTVDSADEDQFIEAYRTGGPKGLATLLEENGIGVSFFK